MKSWIRAALTVLHEANPLTTRILRKAVLTVLHKANLLQQGY